MDAFLTYWRAFLEMKDFAQLSTSVALATSTLCTNVFSLSELVTSFLWKKKMTVLLVFAVFIKINGI